MPKNIIVCSDGTGNSAIKGRGTNVFKLFEAIDLNGHRTDPELTPQVALYDDGVGTSNFRPLKVLGGVTGWGLSRNVKQLYKELVRLYDPGDRIFLFGFSRGAFTARTLADFIARCGILDRNRHARTGEELHDRVEAAYKAYRRCYRTRLQSLLGWKAEVESVNAFRQRYCIRDPKDHGRPLDVRIAFVGVWDTVDAVGMPFHLSDFINMTIYRFKFPDYHLSPLVDRAAHALALDDERHSFHPLLWHLREGDQDRIEQVWFAGAHSNVGGGYEKHGLSLVALEWMIDRAEAAGLRVLAADRQLYGDHANANDKLYDPRAGSGIFYRWKPRDVAVLCDRNETPPVVHLSVIERIAHGTEDYAPGNLPLDSKVVITSTGDAEKDEAAWQRAREVEGVLRRRFETRTLLERVSREVKIGFLSYYVYLVTCSLVLLAAAAPEGAVSRWTPWAFVRNAFRLIGAVLSMQLDVLWASAKRLATSPTLLGVLAAGLVVSYVLAFYADRRMSAVFSEFWFARQQDLREALKRARRAAAAQRRQRPPAA